MDVYKCNENVRITLHGTFLAHVWIKEIYLSQNAISLLLPFSYYKEDIYRVSQKKRNGGFLVHCELKVLHIFISLDRASSAQWEWYLDH